MSGRTPLLVLLALTAASVDAPAQEPGPGDPTTVFASGFTAPCRMEFDSEGDLFVKDGAVMDDALFLQPGGNACFPHQPDEPLFQNACTDASQHMRAGLAFENDAVDTRLLKQEGQKQPRGPSADYGDLCLHDGGSTGGVPWVWKVSMVLRPQA